MKTLIVSVALALLVSCGGGGGGGAPAPQSPGVTLTDIDITPAKGIIPVGQSLQYNAMGIYSDLSTGDITQDVTWTSSNVSVAILDNSQGAFGKFQGLAHGDFVVTAALDGIEVSVDAQVSQAVLNNIFITPSSGTIDKDQTLVLQASGLYSDGSISDLTQQVSWTTDDATIAQVDNSLIKGQVEGVAEGVAMISATMDSKTAVCEITVNQAEISSLEIIASVTTLAAGTSLQLEATGHFNDATQRDLTGYVLWESSDTDIANVSNINGENGLLQAYASGGPVSITAYYKGKSDSVEITVTAATLDSIEILPADSTLSSGFNLQYQALGHFSDGSDQDLTQSALWQIDDKTRASISNLRGLKGLLYSFAAGNLTVSASFGGKQASTSLTITGETLTSIRAIPAYAVVEEGKTLTMVLEGVFSDDSVRDITADALWVSANAQRAVVNNASGHEGTILGVGAGQTFILAVFGQVGYVMPLWVLKPVDSIEITSVNTTIPTEWATAYTATAHYLDGTSEDVTEKVFWESSEPLVADFFDFGQVLGLAEGQTDITVSINGSVSDTVTLDVFVIDNLHLSFDEGTNGAVQFSAYSFYGVDLAINLTQYVTWSSSSDSILTISNENGEKGLAQIHSTGDVSVTAVYSVDVSATLLVPIVPAK